MDQTLRDRRGALEASWRAGVAERRDNAPARPEVLASWQRSSETVRPGIGAAPVAGPDDVARRWAGSRLGRASRVILDDLTDLAGDGDMMAAITDESVTIAWIAGGRTMRRRADRVHFSLGGCWGEEAVGTNALALAERSGRASTVFSAEHYAPMVHDWVCYSAPIMDPETGTFLGVLDLSAMWHKAHPTLLTTVSALTRCVEYELARQSPPSLGPDAGGHGAGRDTLPGEAGGGLVLRTLGIPVLAVDGAGVAVTRRQLELLTVLSLHPEGLSLDEITGRVYGDRSVSPSTVKAELSHLRHQLGGRIGSRPYRLVGPVATDHRAVLDALAAGDLSLAVDLYGGPMLPWSDSPDIDTWRRHVDGAIHDAAVRSGRADLLWALSGRCADDAELQAAALDALGPDDARRSIVSGRLAAATAG